MPAERFKRALSELANVGTCQMKVFGNSMMPFVPDGSIVTLRRQDTYENGDIVFCKVRGRYIDAHRIVKVRHGSYLIANNKGRENGWTRTVYGKVVAVQKPKKG